MIASGDIWGAAVWPPGWRVLHVHETASTNADLLAAAQDGTAGAGTALVADHQTAGRGRLDRRWDAPPGANLLVSLLLDAVPERPAEPMQRVALAACSAADGLVPGRRLEVKWPNDLVVDDRKIGGILAQRADRLVVVGLGFNVGWSPPDAADLAGAVTPAQLLASLLAALGTLPRAVGDLHRRRLATLGRRVRVELPGGAEVVGVAETVDHAGRLVVVDDGGDRRVLDVGDVVHLWPDRG